MLILTDIAIAIPIVLIAIAIISTSLYNNQFYLESYGHSGYSAIKYYGISQLLVSVSQASTANYSETENSLLNLAEDYKISANFTETSNYGQCATSFCRVIEINGITKLMVLR